MLRVCTRVLLVSYPYVFVWCFSQDLFCELSVIKKKKKIRNLKNDFRQKLQKNFQLAHSYATIVLGFWGKERERKCSLRTASHLEIEGDARRTCATELRKINAIPKWRAAYRLMWRLYDHIFASINPLVCYMCGPCRGHKCNNWTQV